MREFAAALLIAVLFFSAAPSAVAQKTQNVVLIVSDGLRWQEVFTGADPHQKFLDLAESAGLKEPLRIGGKLPNGLGVSCKPRQSVRGTLLAVEKPRHRTAVDRDPVGDSAAGVGEQRVDGGRSLVQGTEEFVAGGLGRYGKRHERLRS